MRSLIGLLFLGFIFASYGQRVAVDLNSSFDNCFATFLYCQVFKKTWYVKGGISTGTYGRGTVTKDLRDVFAGNPLVSSYNEMNKEVIPGMILAEYDSKHKGWGMEIGLGKFFEISPIHTFRFDMQLKGYHIREIIWGAYSTAVPDTMTGYHRFEYKRNCFSFGPELFHAIRISGRMTFYYGLKFPFYLPLPTAGYHPHNMKEQTIGFQPNLAIGMSCAISKKKRKE